MPASKADLARIVPLLKSELGVKHVIGCTASGVLGTSEDDGSPEEFEDFKGVSVAAAHLPGVQISTFRIDGKGMPSGVDVKQEEWRKLVGSPPEDKRPALVILGGQDFSARGNLGKLIEGLDFAYSDSVKVGGISSGQVAGGVMCSGEGGLFGGGEDCSDRDAVGMALWGNIECEPIVAQGCRPIGEMYEVRCWILHADHLIPMDDVPVVQQPGGASVSASPSES